LWMKQNWSDEGKDGLWEIYHDNGQLESKENYKDGKKDGVWEYYDKNGQIEYLLYYINGKSVKRKRYLRRR